MTPLYELKNVTKSFGSGRDKTTVLKNINLTINENEFVAIVGFSGTGKTTLINLLAGLLMPDEGEVLYKGKPIKGPSPERGLVFQNYSLMPWLTVHGNVKLAVDQAYPNHTKAERDAIVRKYVEMVDLTPAIDKLPRVLSGGMRQRTSVARALSADPEVLLLDEPLGALDALTRAVLQDQILDIWNENKKSVVLITNSVDEGIYMADRIIPLTNTTPATFGPEFRIPVDRPRHRDSLNKNDLYKRTRNDILAYLSEQRGASDSIEELIARKSRHTQDKDNDTPHDPAKDSYLEIINATKIYPTPAGPFVVLENFNLSMPIHSFTCLIGHSGCGKSTILSMVAGLNEVSSGNIVLDKHEVIGPGTDRAVVFQSPSLLPWLTAWDNVKLGVEQVMPEATLHHKRYVVEQALIDVGLKDSMHKKSAELSQGMRQRVGIARAFALRPKLMLLDEPLGMLDAMTKFELQELIVKLHAEYQLTTLMVTHDVDEALYLSDRVVMMTNGPLAKVGQILENDLPRPRIRKEVLEHPNYYLYREELIQFLEGQDHKKRKAS